MILADKIINLRKKNGWSQEELAEKVGVTRQSVSKWEGAQAAPDLDKILQLGKVFGVSTDYLLKDEIEAPEFTGDEDAEAPAQHRVSLAEASEFLSVKAFTAKLIAFGIYLCILSPLCLLILGAAVETGRLPIGENAAGGIGLSALFVTVAAAVVIFIACGFKTGRFGYLDKEAFDTEYGVSGMVRDRRSKQEPKYRMQNIVGVCICVLAFVPLIVGACFTEDDFRLMILLAVSMATAGIGVVLLVIAGVNRAACDRLLREGDYTRAGKLKENENNTLTGTVSAVYWPIAVAVYLCWSFISGNWGITWIIWPIAGVLFGAVAAVCNAFANNKKK